MNSNKILTGQTCLSHVSKNNNIEHNFEIINSHSRQWIKDLTRECIESNPGPRTIKNNNNNKRNTKQVIVRSVLPRPNETVAQASISVTLPGSILPGFIDIIQGTGPGTRVTQFVHLTGMILRWKLSMFNSDVITTTRLIIFQWYPDTTLLGPGPGDILITVDVLGAYNRANQGTVFKILSDRTYSQAGTGSVPTTSSIINGTFRLPMKQIRRDLTYSSSLAFGANQIFMLALSDSAVTPFPSLQTIATTYYHSG
jgi:hypothetical protein